MLASNPPDGVACAVVQARSFRSRRQGREVGIQMYGRARFWAVCGREGQRRGRHEDDSCDVASSCEGWVGQWRRAARMLRNPTTVFTQSKAGFKLGERLDTVDPEFGSKVGHGGSRCQRSTGAGLWRLAKKAIRKEISPENVQNQCGSERTQMQPDYESSRSGSHRRMTNMNGRPSPRAHPIRSKGSPACMMRGVMIFVRRRKSKTRKWGSKHGGNG